MTTVIEKCPTCGADAVDRSEFWEAYPDNGRELSEQLSQIEKAVRKYYLALDNREHGGVAQDKCLREIQDILNMSWVQGETKEFLERHPKLKPFYEAK